MSDSASGNFGTALRRARHVAAIGLIFAALSACTTVKHVAPPPAPVVEGDRPEPPTPGIKPLTVEQEEQVSGS
ncbi:hypothetical protein [Phyllobacterium pellucidum]|uniref:hypothetical protein n=1 Tax=Phyllobacterium pellucidum TaxID=2740464 RepID=UPI001D14042A|nr:hypothetical protein [Phyllobacterium sp. T1018]UGY10357.1 hypothetical protein LLE51_003990 [Phyllobacterium sp. T1018]